MLQHTSARQDDAWATKSSTPKPPEEVHVLVGFPDQTESDAAPVGFFPQVATKVSIAGDNFHHNCLLVAIIVSSYLNLMVVPAAPTF